MTYHFLYRNGFLITNRPLSNKIPDILHWKELNVAGYSIYTDETVDVYHRRYNDVDIVLIGIVLNPFSKISNPKKILINLCQKFAYSNDRFFDYLDMLSGRFVIFIRSKAQSYIIHDAAGNRSVFYDISDTNHVFVSSHAQLIADLKHYKIDADIRKFMESVDFKNHLDSHLPGVLTPYQNIDLLTPNTLLDLNKYKVKRFFPREPLLGQKVTDQLAEELGALFTNQMDLLRKKYKLSLSLTAGVDSRLSLAAAKKHKNSIHYFTYTTDIKKSLEKDAQAAQKLCHLLNLHHQAIECNQQPDKEFFNLYVKNSAYLASWKRVLIGKGLYSVYPKGLLHVKSNVSEIGRAFYRRKYDLPNKISADIYASLYPIKGDRTFICNAFKQYIQQTELNSQKIFNYDPYDIVYWEYRIGNWQSLVLLETDIIHNTYILYNNRSILKKLLSVPLADRINDTLYIQMIKHMWPDVLQIPINPHKTIKRKRLR
ncbi:hypothetical protein J2S00_001791 [Caldalkalibacillus uzonensis]|uniref:Asparagine synthetase domain-containing protein n=1 Tax=Caldalkalibacillus uzonensis TaxID=353224 RepID=A0ABU0CRH7_9BACI|nr:hypothetical protein [Caldalkalibacillus uzonensis]MDQ0339005.1 hypothetical protein [Caldalkalibacillus uzonensis]